MSGSRSKATIARVSRVKTEASPAKPGDYVIANLRGSEAYLRTGFLKILKRAGIKPLPKLFHNVQASRETELLDEHPIKDVGAWIGNSQAIAMKHYAMCRESSFTKAAGMPLVGGPIGGPIEAENLTTEVNSSQVAIDCGQSAVVESLTNQGDCHTKTSLGDSGQDSENGRRGTRTPDIYFVRVAL